MRNTEQYVAALTDRSVGEIIAAYEAFLREGITDDSPVRVHTTKFQELNNLQAVGSVVVWMELIAFECYRRFALEHMENCK